MAPIPLTPPSSGSEECSPLSGRRAGVNKKRPPTRSSTSSKSVSPKFTWKEHHRKILLVCHQRNLPKKDLVSVFNTIYREDCVLAGYEDGISQRTLESQWQDHRKPSNKSWQKVLACSEDELEESKREIEDCLVKISTSRHEVSDHVWRTSTTNTRVHIFDAQRAPRSMATSSTVQSSDTISIANETAISRSSTSNKRTRSTDQTRDHSGLSSESGFPQQQTRRKAVSIIKARSIASRRDRFPTHDKETRTRIVDGEQIPLAKATDRYLAVPSPIRPDEAHSPVPALLFRTYDSNSQGVRSSAARGELAQNYVDSTCETPRPPPCDDDCLFATIVKHINCVEFTSDVISTTSNLFFALTQAAKSTANPRIKVMRSSLLPKEAIYHARPYHLRIKGKRWFFAGKWNNSTYHEYLIWAKIPQTAVLCDFSFADLERHLVGNPSMQRVLRIDSLRSNDSNTNLRNQFKKENLILSFPMVEGLAIFLRHFAIDVRTPGTIIARLVSETMRGFVIGLSETTALRWDMLAQAFAFALTAHEPNAIISERTLFEVKEAFKLGLCTSLGDINWHLDANKKRLMLMRGVQKGLDMRMVLADEIPIKQCRMDSANVGNGSHFIDLTGDDNDDHDEDEEHSEEPGEDSGNGDIVVDQAKESEAEIKQAAQPKHHNRVDTSKDDQMTDDQEAETEVKESAQPRPRLQNLNKYRLADVEDEEAETEIDELAQSGPRLSQRMRLSSYTDQRRRRSARRRSTPIRYNFSRADEVFDIVGPSDGSDDDYTGLEADEDDMEF